MRRAFARHLHRGFSLVEIMVGLVIGLVVTLIIYQVVIDNEGLRRSTSAGAEAQHNGLFALSVIERDVRAAGWGMPSADVMRCGRWLTYMDAGGGSGPVPDFPLGPLRISDGGDAPGASDRITLIWGTSVRANVANPLLQNVTAIPPDSSTSVLRPASKVALSGNGGFVWLTDDNAHCQLMRISAVAPNPELADAVQLEHVPAVGSAAQPNYNAPGEYMSAQGWPVAYTANPRLYDLGALTLRTYSVEDLSLVALDRFTVDDRLQVASDVVALKAWYGVSDAGQQAVTQWVRAQGLWAMPSSDDIRRIKALRIAVVVRSAIKERPDADSGDCAVTTVAPKSWPDGPAIDLSNDPDWGCYRYRSFETVVPLRNVLWANLE